MKKKKNYVVVCPYHKTNGVGFMDAIRQTHVVSFSLFFFFEDQKKKKQIAAFSQQETHAEIVWNFLFDYPCDVCKENKRICFLKIDFIIACNQ